MAKSTIIYTCRPIVYMILVTLASSQELDTKDNVESVIIQPVEQIWTSKSSWIISTAIDYEPYGRALFDIRNYAISVWNNMHEFYKTFKLEDDRYMKLINMTREDLDRPIDRLTDIHSRFYNLIGKTRNHPSNIVKRSLLPLRNIFGFLFGTASSGDIKGLKKDIQTLYANQVKHGEILNEVITIKNISRGLIHENRLTINNLIDSVEFLNETLVNIHEDIEPLFATRRFLLVHGEVQIHSHRLRASIDKINDDVNHLCVYLNVLSTGKLSPDTVDPIHLGKELTDMQK